MSRPSGYGRGVAARTGMSTALERPKRTPVAPCVAHDGLAALDATDATDATATFHPDVALLDMGLPAMDGYELASRIRDHLAVTISA